MGKISSTVERANYQIRFRPIWQSSLTSELGGALFTFCNSVLIYQLTGSAAALGIVWLIYYVPSFFMQLFIGPYIDRWSRRKTMMICQGVRALLALSLAAMVIADILAVSILYIFQVVIGLIMPIFTPANQAILPSIIKPDELPKANSSLETIRQVMAVMGPVAGGVVVDYMAIQWILLTVGIAFSLSAYFLLAVREPALRLKER